MPDYEVYALKYGERDTKTCQFFYRDEEHAPLTLHYFVWLILGGPHPVLVDTGFLEDDAEKRGIRNYVRPSTVVEKVAGVKANNIPIALISHLHYDHWAGHSLFPNARSGRARMPAARRSAARQTWSSSRKWCRSTTAAS
jgi:glyoxylase-like metal-dependent hydrolase (beta-lactamase superfamily II)